MVRMRGLEPPPPCEDQNLNLARLPISPHPHIFQKVLRFWYKTVVSSPNLLQNITMPLEPESKQVTPVHTRTYQTTRQLRRSISVKTARAVESGTKLVQPAFPWGSFEWKYIPSASELTRTLFSSAFSVSFWPDCYQVHNFARLGFLSVSSFEITHDCTDTEFVLFCRMGLYMPHGRESRDHQIGKVIGYKWLRALGSRKIQMEDGEVIKHDVYSHDFKIGVEVGNCPAERILRMMLMRTPEAILVIPFGSRRVTLFRPTLAGQSAIYRETYPPQPLPQIPPEMRKRLTLNSGIPAALPTPSPEVGGGR